MTIGGRSVVVVEVEFEDSVDAVTTPTPTAALRCLGVHVWWPIGRRCAWWPDRDDGGRRPRTAGAGRTRIDISTETAVAGVDDGAGVRGRGAAELELLLPW